MKKAILMLYLSIIDDIKKEIQELAPIHTTEDYINGSHIKDAIWEVLIEVENIIDKHIGKEFE